MKYDHRTKRDPEGTREALLNAAFQEIHRAGFQAASLDRILANAGVTKGALYHHFPNKAALGKAVVDEVVRVYIWDQWVRPLKDTDDPLTALQECLRHVHVEMTADRLELGCPLNNLMQEMSPVDEDFRRHLQAVADAWREGVGGALRRGQERGTVRPDIDPDKIAGFLFAVSEGIAGTAKSAQSLELLQSNIAVLHEYLESLRARSAGGEAKPAA